MATVINPQLANLEVSSRWGMLKFDAHGQCDVSDELGAQIHDAAVKGFLVAGLPQPAASLDEINNESLDDELSAAPKPSAPVVDPKPLRKKAR